MDAEDDLSQQIDHAVAEGERLCVELKAQLESAKALVRQAKQHLKEAENPRGESRSFAKAGDKRLN